MRVVPGVRPRLWLPKRVLVTRSAAERPHGKQIVDRCEASGVTDIELLRADRLPPLRGADERATYALAKSTLAVVVSAPSRRRLQPIPPSADWRVDLAQGCPAHCQYCYLAGSLSGPPITRVFADLDDILAGLDAYVGQGGVTSGSATRGGEGTTFEASCYTDPLGIEHLTGSLAATITHFGTHFAAAPVQLRFTTKYDAVTPLLDLPHHGRTRTRFSLNVDAVAGRFEGGAAPVAGRLAALEAMAGAGYPVGVTIAPIMPVDDWRDRYGALLDAVADATPEADLTVELITHRFTARSKDVLTGWYPRTRLDLDETARAARRTKFGGTKYVYPPAEMATMRAWFTDAVAQRLPHARLLYWT